MMLVFILGFFSTEADAKNCIQIPPSELDYATGVQVNINKMPDGINQSVKIPTHDGYIILTRTGEKTGRMERHMTVQQAKGADGKYISLDKKDMETGYKAMNNKNASKFYKEGGMLDGNANESYAPEGNVTEINPNGDGTSEVVTQTDFNLDDIFGENSQADLAQDCIDIYDKNPGKSAEQLKEQFNEAYDKRTNHNSEGAKARQTKEDMWNMFKQGKGRLEKHKKESNENKVLANSYRMNYPPQEICDEDTPDGERMCAIWNKIPQPSPVTCDDGTHQGVRVECKILKEKEPKSSYTTQTPNQKGKTVINESFCSDQRDGYLQFSQIMNPFGDRSYTNPQILNNGINNYSKKKPMDKFENNYWKSSYRGEIRTWNPFVDGNKLSGIPYNVTWTGLFDGWTEKEYSINPYLSKSVDHLRTVESKNAQIASKYSQDKNKFKIYMNAPNKKMRVTALNLDTNTWDSADTSNLYCVNQYELKIEPGYDLHRYTIFQKYDHHITQGKSYTYTCVKTDECKRWSRRCIDRDYETRKCLDWEDYCAAYYTEGKEVDLGRVDTKYPDGQATEGPTPAGSIPPVYKQRRKYQYRTGALVECHTMTRPYGKTSMIPVPNSKDTSKMKSGYGFGYTSGVQMITDYDRAPSTYKFNPVIIRPNKATNLNIRTNNYKSSYGLFDSNVRYNKAKNAPERSSSIDKTFIEETLKGGLTKTTFKPSAISNVEKVDGKAKDFTDVEAMPVKSSMVRKTAVKWGEMTSTFKISSNPAKYYHAYWKTKGEPNLIPAYKPGPLHYVYLDYPSGTDYTVASLDTINLNGKGFFATGMNTGSIKIVGNMWEDSFSRPNFKK